MRRQRENYGVLEEKAKKIPVITVKLHSHTNVLSKLVRVME
jgi:hypothetical protein